MIVRTVEGFHYLVHQMEHARQTGVIAAHLRPEFLGPPSFQWEIMEASACHDLGWESWDAAPRFRENGLPVEVRENLGSAVVFSALRQNNVDCYVEYSGTIWANFMKRDTNPGPEVIYEEAEKWLAEIHGIDVIGHAGFENLYTLAMKRGHAERLSIKTIDDLARHASDLVLASDLEFFGRPEWATVRDTYDLEFKNTKGFDAALMYSAVREGQVDVITAYSTDGRIAAYDLVVLDDPRNAFLPYDAMLLASPEASRNAAFAETLGRLRNAISNETMQQANKIVDVDGRPVQEAVQFLKDAISTR